MRRGLLLKWVVNEGQALLRSLTEEGAGRKVDRAAGFERNWGTRKR